MIKHTHHGVQNTLEVRIYFGGHINVDLKRPIPVAARSKAWVCSHSLAGLAVSNPTTGTNVSFEDCVFSGRGLCD